MNGHIEKAIDEVKVDVKDIREKFETHVHMRANHDQEVALSLQQIKNTGEQTLEQATKTNGKIAEHEKRLNDLSPIVEALSSESRVRQTEDSRKWRFWWEWGVRVGLLILGIALTKLGIIAVPLW